MPPSNPQWSKICAKSRALATAWDLYRFGYPILYSETGDWWHWPKYPQFVLSGDMGYAVVENADEVRMFRQPDGKHLVIYQHGKGGMARAFAEGFLPRYHEMVVPAVPTIVRPQGSGWRPDRQHRRSRPLAEQDDSPIPYTVRGGDRTMQQRHRTMSNLLRRLCAEAEREVREVQGLYDGLICFLDRPTLVEIKSDVDSQSILLGIGQLQAYSLIEFGVLGKCDLAILLPRRPHDSVISLLSGLQIRTMWIDGETIQGLDIKRPEAA